MSLRESFQEKSLMPRKILFSNADSRRTSTTYFEVVFKLLEIVETIFPNVRIVLKRRKKKERFLQKGIKHGANNPEI